MELVLNCEDPELRNYQITVKNKAIELFNSGNYVYLQMPTGTGKTITAKEIIKEIGAKSCLWVVGSIEMVYQTASLLPPSVTVSTWQGVLNNYQLEEFDFLVIDEVHFGGSQNGTSKIFSTLVEAFRNKKKLYISASPWDLDFSTLGDILDRDATYYIEDAYKDGNIPDLTMRQVRVGKNLLMVDAFCQTHMEELETLEDEPLLAFLDEHKLDRQNFESIKGVLKNRVDALVELYSSEYSNKTALFFVPNLSLIEYAVNQLSSKGISCSFVSYKELNNSKTIQNFKEGGTQAMVVCNMLTFGFDMPSLDLAFDGYFSCKNVRRNYQKIGRLLRKVDGKNSVTYVYARDVGNISAINCSASADLFRIMYCDRHFLPSKNVEVLEGVFSEGKIASFSSILAAVGQEDYGLAKFSNIVDIHYKHFPEAKKRTLLLMAARGNKRPSEHNKNDLERKLAHALYEYTTPNRLDFDVAFTKEINSLAPSWFCDTAAERRNALMAIAKKGKKISDFKQGLSGFTYLQLKNAMSSYTRQENLQWNVDFLKELLKIDPTMLGCYKRVEQVRKYLQAVGAL